MRKPLAVIVAPVASQSGYGAHARDLTRAIIAMDLFDVKIFPINWGATPNNFLVAGVDDELSFINLSINPNPAENILNINLNGYHAINNIKIYDVKGNVVKNTNETTINISELNSGVYFVLLFNNEKLIGTKMFIKK